LRKRIVIVFLALLFGVGLLVYVGQRGSRQGELYYSGTIEATTAHLAFPVGGRIQGVAVQEGQAVAAGQVLATLDAAEYRARLDQAQANLDKAEKGREQAGLLLTVYEKALPADEARAAAGVRALQAQLDELKAGSRSQERARAEQARLAAAAVLEDARKDRERYEALFKKGTVSEKERDAVRLRYDTALREYESRREMEEQVREGSRQETIRMAEAKLAEGEALLNQARSNLGRIAAARKEREAAQAAVAAARAARDQAAVLFGYTQLKAPRAGIVTSRSAEPGEVVTAGREVLTLADLSTVELKLFVDETQIGQVKTGQRAEVRVDSFPDKTFAGTVTFISPEGEFTPKVIQTRKERVKLVYLVKVTLPNPQQELKSGTPADAWLR
jgi:HlyD family secretion protein